MKLKEVEVVNVVVRGSFDVDRLDFYYLAEVLRDLGVMAYYEPETFPALIIRKVKPKGSIGMRLFRNGGFSVSGAKSYEEALEFIHEVAKLLDDALTLYDLDRKAVLEGVLV